MHRPLRDSATCALTPEHVSAAHLHLKISSVPSRGESQILRENKKNLHGCAMYPHGSALG